MAQRNIGRNLFCWCIFG